jgi:hypothetical protein
VLEAFQMLSPEKPPAGAAPLDDGPAGADAENAAPPQPPPADAAAAAPGRSPAPSPRPGGAHAEAAKPAAAAAEGKQGRPLGRRSRIPAYNAAGEGGGSRTGLSDMTNRE